MSRVLMGVGVALALVVGIAALVVFPHNRTETGPAIFSSPQQMGLVDRGPATSRVALVIGIDKYRNLGPDQQLQRAKSDAQGVAAKLTSMGYDTILDTDATRKEIYADLDRALKKIKPGGAAFFYFAGHGISIQAANYLDGANYLVPSDAPSPDKRTLSTFEYSSVPVLSIIQQFRRSGARISVIVLDACRDSPYQGQSKFDRAQTAAPTGTKTRSDFYILYSASPGQVALDRLQGADSNPNSVFTRVLLRNLSDQVRLEDLTRTLQSGVSQISNGTQKPVAYSGTDGRFTVSGAIVDADRRLAVAGANTPVSTGEKAPMAVEVQESVDQARTAEADAREWAHSAEIAEKKSVDFAAQAEDAQRRSQKKLPGYGTKQLEDGSLYEGQLAGGEPSGVGVATKAAVYVYKGQWTAGQKNGFGTYQSLKNHFTYAGEWQNNDKNGAAVYRLPTGEVYAGEFHYGKPDGFGVLRGGPTDPWLEQVGQFNDQESSYSVEYLKANRALLGMTRHGKLQGPAAKLDREGHVIEQGFYEDDVLKTEM